MTVCVALEHRFCRLPDGSVWSRTQFARSFWQRYLDVFDGVRCIARVQDVAALDGEWHRSDGDGVGFTAVPCYVGPLDFLRRARSVRAAIDCAIRPGDAFVLRVPGNIGTMLWSRLRAAGHPYAVEVVQDPHDVFSPGAVDHPLRALFRWQAARQLRLQCASACAASYVTEGALQRRYPPPARTVVASSVELPERSFRTAPRTFHGGRRMELIFVGSLAQRYKAPDVLIAAFSRLLAAHLDVGLTIVGDGAFRATCERLAVELQCAERIRFVGQLSAGDPVRDALDRADVFVLPSRSEGLPRAMIEAMARGLPCVGSTVGGIPELLSPEDLVPPGDPVALADKLRDVLREPGRLQRMSEANLERARAYQDSRLRERRTTLYRWLRDATESWGPSRTADVRVEA